MRIKPDIRRRRAVAGILAGIIFFAMFFTVGVGLILYTLSANNKANQAQVSAIQSEQAKGAESLVLQSCSSTIQLPLSYSSYTGPCSGTDPSVWIQNNGGATVTLKGIYITQDASGVVTQIEGPTTSPSTQTSPTLPVTIDVGSTLLIDTNQPAPPAGDSYTIEFITQTGNTFSADYPPLTTSSTATSSSTSLSTTTITNTISPTTSTITSTVTSTSGTATYTTTTVTTTVISTTVTVSSGLGTSLTTILSASVITPGEYVYDQAILQGATAGAGGTVQYLWFGNGVCSGSGNDAGPTVNVHNGAVPSSSSVVGGEVTFNIPGSYSWDAVYSGDANNLGSTSACEPLLVETGNTASSSGLGFLTFDFPSFTVYPVNSESGCSGTDYPGGANDYAVVGGVYPTNCQLGTGSPAYTLNNPNGWSGSTAYYAFSIQVSSTVPNPGGPGYLPFTLDSNSYMEPQVVCLSDDYCEDVSSPTAFLAAWEIGCVNGNVIETQSACSTLQENIYNSQDQVVGTGNAWTIPAYPDFVTIYWVYQLTQAPPTLVDTIGTWGCTTPGETTCDSLSTTPVSLYFHGIAGSSIYGEQMPFTTMLWTTTSNTPTVTVTCTPGGLSPSVGVGATQTCTATVSGADGTVAGETIYWSQSPDDGTVDFTPSSATCTLSSGTSPSCSVQITGEGTGGDIIEALYPGDSNNAANSGSVEVQVESPGLVITLSAVPTEIETGQTAVLTATATGGSGTYSNYAFYSGSNCLTTDTGALYTGSSNTYSAQPSSTGTYTYCVEVTDSAGATAVSSTVTVTVITGPSLTVSASPSTIDTGETSTVTATASGGLGPYTYSFYSGSCTGTALQSGSSNTYSAKPTVTTGYCVMVTDSLGGTATSTATVVVNPALTAGSITPSAPVIDKGQSITLSASWTYGTSTYSVSWYSSSTSTCGTGSTLVVTHSGVSASPNTESVSPSSTTYYCAVITDSASPSESVTDAAVQLTVDSDPTAGAITSPETQFPAGTPVTLTANPSGGTGTFSYQWYTATSSGTCSASDATISGATSSTYAIPTGTAAGTHYYCYIITDTGVTSGATPTITADSPTDTITITTPTITLSPTTDPAGTSVTVTGSGFSVLTNINTFTFGGTTPGTQTCTTQTTTNAGGFSCTFTVPSDSATSYTVTATGSDGSPDTASATFTIKGFDPASGSYSISEFGSGTGASDLTITTNNAPDMIFACEYTVDTSLSQTISASGLTWTQDGSTTSITTNHGELTCWTATDSSTGSVIIAFTNSGTSGGKVAFAVAVSGSGLALDGTATFAKASSTGTSSSVTFSTSDTSDVIIGASFVATNPGTWSGGSGYTLQTTTGSTAPSGAWEYALSTSSGSKTVGFSWTSTDAGWWITVGQAIDPPVAGTPAAGPSPTVAKASPIASAEFPLVPLGIGSLFAPFAQLATNSTERPQRKLAEENRTENRTKLK